MQFKIQSFVKKTFLIAVKYIRQENLLPGFQSLFPIKMYTASKQKAEKRNSMVELHLLVIESQHKSNRPQQVMTLTKANYTPKGKAKAQAVISTIKSRINNQKFLLQHNAITIWPLLQLISRFMVENF